MKNIWIVGAGYMAQEYIKVLNGLKKEFTVIGRGIENAKLCEQATGVSVVTGGLDQFLLSNTSACSHAIVAVNAEYLYQTCKLLLETGVKFVLVEKPAAFNKGQLVELKSIADRNNAKVIIGYNRRFYTATEKAKEIIEEDGGVTSFNFEFTEWGHIFENGDFPKNELEKLFIGNSTHPVDLAFYLGGKPKEIVSFTSGSLDWHKSASVFAGAGVSETGALFSYQANWAAPGRWSVEILTKKHRLIFRPMEKLQIQNIGSVAMDFVDIDDKIDQDYKPGLFKQVDCFLNAAFSDFCSLEWQIDLFDVYLKMANYKL